MFDVHVRYEGTLEFAVVLMTGIKLVDVEKNSDCILLIGKN